MSNAQAHRSLDKAAALYGATLGGDMKREVLFGVTIAVIEDLDGNIVGLHARS